MVQCFAAECDHSYSKNQCSFFRLPSDIRARRKWEQLCGRPPDISNENSRICSCHFEGGMKSAAPTVFKWTEKVTSSTTSPPVDPKEEVEEKDIMSAAPGGVVVSL
ncbi:52 kDa repressor of the inhibitor of the protein kinase-like isoform X2 [Silurus meridionalis]|uniref:THAP-type domain-containing protein n=1 Tax=Silurus meridionalis TaxID=175797 RepID=A0A8T0A855_SILME|nr:52 kDa repressor of the inhibitor of the protein kinase-like isoform X2 [Silurus meridionalis]KAF7686691.1 hypothetical protein HF521_015084 [Silurus meridionalis]